MSGNGHDMTVSQMHWQPPLIKLTQIANPDHDANETTPCYICPQQITMIARGFAAFSKTPKDGRSFDKDNPEWHPFIECTLITITSQLGLRVIESPEQVAMMRDRALGHEPKLGAV